MNTPALMNRITTQQRHDALENEAIKHVAVFGMRRHKHDTRFYLIAVLEGEPRLYEAEENVGPRAWRKFETLVNFLQTNYDK